MPAEILPFSHYQMENIPESLRLLANQIEADPTKAIHCVICLEDEEGRIGYRAFGQDFSILHAVGIVDLTKHILANQVLPDEDK